MNEWSKESLEEMFGDNVIEQLTFLSGCTKHSYCDPSHTDLNGYIVSHEKLEKFAELIVKEMCGMMEQAEDDAYHCFDPSERPTEYIEWLRNWQERFTKHFGVDE